MYILPLIHLSNRHTLPSLTIIHQPLAESPVGQGNQFQRKFQPYVLYSIIFIYKNRHSGLCLLCRIPSATKEVYMPRRHLRIYVLPCCKSGILSHFQFFYFKPHHNWSRKHRTCGNTLRFPNSLYQTRNTASQSTST